MTNVLKYLRELNNYSQEELAEKLDITRQSYIKYEKTGVINDVALVKKIAELFDVDYSCIIENKIPKEYSYNVIGKESEDKESDMRINIPINNIEKFKQVFLYILNKVGAKPNIGQTVLYKLLYFIDFDYYELFEEQLMGLKYIKNTYGPTPVDFAKIVKEMEDDGQLFEVNKKFYGKDIKKYLPMVETDLTLLSARELNHIDKTLERLSDKTAKELSDYSHKDIPWIGTKERDIIDYDAVFYRNEATSVREYDDEQD